MFNSEKSGRFYEITLALAALLYILGCTYTLYSSYVISDFEHFMKLDFLLHPLGLLTFFPGQHEINAFHGHPGFHQFITFLFLLLTGKSFYALQALHLITLMLTGWGIYRIALTLLNNRPLSLLFSLSFILTPTFLITSTHYTHDHFALLLSIWGIYFFLIQRDRWSVLFFSLSCLTMESYIAFPVFIALFMIYKSQSKKAFYLYFIPVILLAIFFLWEYLVTGNVSNSTVALVDWGREQKSFLRSWGEIKQGGLTIIRGYAYLISTFFLALLFSFWKKIKIDSRLIPFSGVLFTFIFFYLFINVNPLLEDFFILSLVIHLYLIFLSHCMDNMWKKIFITLLLTVQLFSFSQERRAYVEMYAQKWQLLRELGKELRKLPQNSCYSLKGTQGLLKFSFSGFAPDSNCFSNDEKKVNSYVKFRGLLIYPWKIGEATYVPQENSVQELTEKGFQLISKKSDLVKELWNNGKEVEIGFQIFKLK